MIALRWFVPLFFVAAACHEDSSDPPLERTATTNLGVAGFPIGVESVRLVELSEGEAGHDLNGDGDALDPVAHVVDLYRRKVTNTGLVIGMRRSVGYGPPPVVASVPFKIAFGVDERRTGGLDRNGDGDAEDIVLAYYDLESETITNLGLAVTSVVATHDVLAFDFVREAVDLNGDGFDEYVTEPFVHDMERGETHSIGPVGELTVMAVQGDFVALAADEDEIGDLNGDGDEDDYVAAFYDLETRALQFTDFALVTSLGQLLAPVPHRGRWSILTRDDVRGEEHVVYDPATGTSRNLGRLLPHWGFPWIEPFVVSERASDDNVSVVWLYDADTDSLVSTGLQALDVKALGGRLVISVDELEQGEDLDGNGTLAGSVPVLYDPLSGDVLNLGLSGMVQVAERELLILHSTESVARRDWNGDGDREDVVLFTWTARNGKLVNTRQATSGLASALGEDIVMLTLDEEERGHDLNGDGDLLDHVLHLYEATSRRLTNVGLAMGYTMPRIVNRSLYAVSEAGQGQDLNGDGEMLDDVLHETGLLFYGRP